jgi:hypothetical protein
MNQPLKVGDLLRCPHCRRWHPVVKWHSEGTAYTLRMLYFECRGQRYYAGTGGFGESRVGMRREPTVSLEGLLSVGPD